MDLYNVFIGSLVFWSAPLLILVVLAFLNAIISAITNGIKGNK